MSIELITAVAIAIYLTIGFFHQKQTTVIVIKPIMFLAWPFTMLHDWVKFTLHTRTKL